MSENNHNSEQIDMPDEIPKFGFEYHVLTELKRLNINIEKAIAGHEDLTAKYFELREQIAIIKTKVAFFGGLAGIVGSIIGWAFQWLVSKAF